jgi:hypothetical protein
MVKVWRRTETGEAPRRQAGVVPAARTLRGGVEGATTEKYREYLSEEQRSRRGCIARRMQAHFCHGLLFRISQLRSVRLQADLSESG